VVSGKICTRKEECGEELLSTVKLFCHSASNGRFSCAGGPVKPHNECFYLNDEVDPVVYLLEDSNLGVLVVSRYVKLVTVVVEGTWSGRLCQGLKSS